MAPLGSTERHGPCLPEGTDHIIAGSFARAAAPETGHQTQSDDAIDNTGNDVLGDPTPPRPSARNCSRRLTNLREWLAGQPFEELAPKPHVQAYDPPGTM